MTDTTELVTKFTFDGNLSILKDYNKELGQAILQSKKFKGTGTGSGGGGAGGGSGAVVVGTAGKGKKGTGWGIMSKGAVAAAAAGAAAFLLGKRSLDYAALLGEMKTRRGESVNGLQDVGYVAATVGIDTPTFLDAVKSLNIAANAATLDYNEVFGRVGLNTRQRAIGDEDGNVQTGAPKKGLQILADLRRIYNEKDADGKPRLRDGQKRYLTSLFPMPEIMANLLLLNDAKYKEALTKAQGARTTTTADAVAALKFKESLVEGGVVVSRIFSGAFGGLFDKLGQVLDHAITEVTKGSTIDNIAKGLEYAMYALGLGLGAKLVKLFFKGIGSLYSGGKVVAEGAKAAKRGRDWDKAGGPTGKGKAAPYESMPGYAGFKDAFTKLYRFTRKMNQINKDKGSKTALIQVGIYAEYLLAVLKRVLEPIMVLIGGFMVAFKTIGAIQSPEDWMKDHQLARVPSSRIHGLAPRANVSAPVNQNITFNITSDDPVAVGREVKKVLTREVRDTQSMNNAGGL